MGTRRKIFVVFILLSLVGCARFRHQHDPWYLPSPGKDFYQASPKSIYIRMRYNGFGKNILDHVKAVSRSVLEKKGYKVEFGKDIDFQEYDGLVKGFLIKDLTPLFLETEKEITRQGDFDSILLMDVHAMPHLNALHPVTHGITLVHSLFAINSKKVILRAKTYGIREHQVVSQKYGRHPITKERGIFIEFYYTESESALVHKVVRSLFSKLPEQSTIEHRSTLPW